MNLRSLAVNIILINGSLAGKYSLECTDLFRTPDCKLKLSDGKTISVPPKDLFLGCKPLKVLNDKEFCYDKAKRRGHFFFGSARICLTNTGDRNSDIITLNEVDCTW